MYQMYIYYIRLYIEPCKGADMAPRACVTDRWRAVVAPRWRPRGLDGFEWRLAGLPFGLQGLHRRDRGGDGLVDRNLTMQADQADDLGDSFVQSGQRQ